MDKILEVIKSIGDKYNVEFAETPIESDEKLSITLRADKMPENFVRELKTKFIVEFGGNIKISSWGKNYANIKLKTDKIYEVAILGNNNGLDITVTTTNNLNESVYNGYL